MNDIKAHVDTVTDFADRFVDAWHRAERGELTAANAERHLSFDSLETLARTLTPKRMELVRHLRRFPAPSVNALAKALGRDYRRVHEDVAALTGAGLIDREGTRLTAPYDSIATRIDL